MPAMSNLTGKNSYRNHNNTFKGENDDAKGVDKTNPDPIIKKYLRGKGVALKNLKGKKLKGKMAAKEACC